MSLRTQSNIFNRDECLKFTEKLRLLLGFTSMEDWYKVRTIDFLKNGGKALYHKHKSIANILLQAYHHHKWDSDKFASWKDMDKQRNYLDALSQKLGYTSKEDWYKVSRYNFCDKGGYNLMQIYGKSPTNIVITVYSDHIWEMWCFKKAPVGFWKEKDNQLKYLEWLFRKLGYTQLEDYYRISTAILRENYGRPLLSHYGGSPSRILASLYPQHPWDITKFKTVTKVYWNDKQNQLKFMDALGKELGFQQMADWYSINKANFENRGYSLLLKYRCSPSEVVMSVYPSHPWEEWKFNKKLHKYGTANHVLGVAKVPHMYSFADPPQNPIPRSSNHRILGMCNVHVMY